MAKSEVLEDSVQFAPPADEDIVDFGEPRVSRVLELKSNSRPGALIEYLTGINVEAGFKRVLLTVKNLGLVALRSISKE